MFDGDSVYDAISAHSAWVFYADVDACFDAGIHHQRLLMQIMPARLPNLAGQRRHHRSQTDACHVRRAKTVMAEQPQKLQPILIRHPIMISRQPPTRA